MKIVIIAIIAFLVYAVFALLKGNVYIKKIHLSRKNGFDVSFEKNETNSTEENPKDKKNEEPSERGSRSKKK